MPHAPEIPVGTVPEEAQRRIRAAIDQIESENNMRVIFACESGSRAWGFASPDSDFDARFLYARPLDWYLSIAVERKRDVIEKPIVDDLDINGWDIRKALNLLHKSNPPLLEWLGSPITYLDRFGCGEMLRELSHGCYSPIACAYHYKQMGRRNFEAYGRGETVRLKKYFYMLRPLLAVRWIEAGRGLVPTEFARLLEAEMPPVGETGEVRREVDALLQQKMAAGEMAEGAPLKYLHPWLEAELSRLADKRFDLPDAQMPPQVLDEAFRELLRRVWKDV